MTKQRLFAIPLVLWLAAYSGRWRRRDIADLPGRDRMVV